MSLKLRKTTILFLCLLTFNSFIFSQFKSHIQVVLNETQYENGRLTVKYNLLNAKEHDHIRVWIDLFDSKNDTIKAKSWQGDVRRIVSGKEEKVATWDLFKDGVDLIDSIRIKISATLENRLYLDDPLILSTLYPGWGDYKLKPKKPYWIYGALGYSFLGASAGMHYNALKNIHNYQNEKISIPNRNSYYNNAVLSKNLSYAFIGMAGTIWMMDYIRLIKRKSEIKQLWKKHLPEKENPAIPSFVIVSAISNKIFVNTRLTNLQLVERSVKYIDIDGNSCLDAFEEGFIQFELYNKGPAKALSFYVKVKSVDKNGKISFPDSLNIGTIGINQSRKILFPIRAKKNIEDGTINLQLAVGAIKNLPVEPFNISVNTCRYDYPNTNENELVSDIDFEIPVLPQNEREIFALVIGNEGYANEYTGLSKNFNVPFARNDALAFKKYAINVLGVKEKNLVIILDAKKKEMMENILVLTDRVKQLKNQAELIFYFAGHGLSDTSTTAPYLMPVDIPPGKISQGVSLDSLYRKIADSKPYRGIVFFDAAFNNSGRNIGLRGPEAPKFQNRPEVIPTNTVVFSGAWKNSEIYSYNEKHHGLFTYAILKVLKNTKGHINFLQFDNLINNEILSVTKIPNENRATTTLFSKDISDIWPNWIIR
jgi:hypothetical protein